MHQEISLTFVKLVHCIYPKIRLASVIFTYLVLVFFAANQQIQAQIAANKNFSPISVVAGQTSSLTVDLFNPGGVDATSTAFTDNLPSGMVIATPPNVTNTCGGVTTATAGTTSFSLSGGTISAAVGATPGNCKVSVLVISNTPNSYVNTLPAGSVTSSRGSNGSPASATLTVAPLASVTGSKIFSPANIHGDNISTLTITVTNPNAIPLTNVGLTDTLPNGLIMSSPTGAATTCGGTVSATAGLRPISLSSGSIPASSSCTITVNVKSSVGSTNYSNGSLTNTIAANSISTAQSVTNSSAITRAITVQTGAQVTKAFAPASISAGGTSTLTFTLNNFNNSVITNANFLDVMPAGVIVTGITSNTCSGTPTFTAGQVQLANGTVPAAPAGTGAGTCTLSATVTAPATGSYVNSVPAGNLNGINYPAATATLTVTPPSSVSVTKAFSPTSTPQTGTSTLTITLNNTSASAATITSFTDLLTTMGTGISIAPAPAASTTCGGTVTAPPGGTSITKTNGAIPANGNCRIVVPVLVAGNATASARTNTIAVNGLQTSAGNNTVAATATLTVQTGATIAKSFATNPVPSGGFSRLTITITHRNGAAAFTGLGITDNLPAGHTISTVPNVANTCGGAVSAPASGSSIVLTGGALATGTTSCTISVNVRAPVGAGSATNTIAINSLVTDQGVSNATTATSTLTRINTWLTLNKSFSPTSISPGGTSRLTVIISNNNGSSINLTGVGLTDSFPGGMTIQSPANATFTGAGCSGGTITATPGNVQISISGANVNAGSICALAVDVTTTFTGTLTNTLPINTAISAQGVTNNNAPSASLTLLGSADVRVSKTDGVTTVQAGGSTTYTIIVSNSGPDNLAGIGVLDNAPSGMTFTSWNCSPSAGSSCTDATGSGDLNTTVSLLNGGTATFSVNASIASAASGSATNTVTVVEPATVNDPDRTNNMAMDTDAILPSPDLTINKSHTGNFLQGQTGVIYTLTVNNIGTAASNGTVTVTDTFPFDLTPVSASGTGWSCGITGQTVTCTRTDALAVSTSYPNISVMANVSITAPASVTNTGYVSGGGEPSGHLSNNSAPDTATIDVPIPDVTLVKSVLPIGDQPPETDLTYKIIFTNIGTGAAQQLVIADPVPENTDFKLGSVTMNLGTTGLTVAVEYSDDSGTSWVYTPISGGGGAISGYDRNVTNVRWRFTVGSLNPTPPDNLGDIGFTTRIR